jgi:hypothetical protein
MAKRMIDHVNMGYSWTSYIAATYGALKSAGLWDDELYLLAGMSGIAFHFIFHECANVTSSTVYDWNYGHHAAMDRIGIHSEIYLHWNHRLMNTAQSIQADAVKRMKQSIDRGVPVVYWAPTDILEFGILYGYDDRDQVFFCRACANDDPDPVLYANIGCSEVPILFYQIFRSKVSVDPEKVYRNSLAFGLSEWQKGFHVNPHYASGIKAYDNLIGTLRRGDYQEFGLSYLISVYNDSKHVLHAYMEYIAEHTRKLSGVSEIAALYAEISELFSACERLIPFKGSAVKENHKGILDRTVIPEILEKIIKAKHLETEAMKLIDQAIS